MNNFDDIYNEKKVKWPNNFKSNYGMDANTNSRRNLL